MRDSSFTSGPVSDLLQAVRIRVTGLPPITARVIHEEFITLYCIPSRFFFQTSLICILPEMKNELMKHTKN